MGKKISAIDAIIQPFQFESKSTQTHSEPRNLRLGGKTITLSVFNKKKGEWETITKFEGGQVIAASYRIRTGKTKKDRKGKDSE